MRVVALVSLWSYMVVQCCAVLCSAVQCCAVLCCAVLCSAVQCCAVLCRAASDVAFRSTCSVNAIVGGEGVDAWSPVFSSAPFQPLAHPHTHLPPLPTFPPCRLVEPVAAEHDLDNLRLEELGPGRPAMEALFELEALMLTGMCLDLSSLAARLREQVCEASVVGPRGWQCGGWADSGTCVGPAA